ncbi:hypothetical protein SUGI_1053090 [Cryptomeria japonica]|uniref:uncharacterized protein LOC131859045 n=1 Tax=Cryptomeria japonica TaxID=3369 RepID=UPI002414C6A2|nr:uncharacterized protein LOC131859045 [Cryptomeria japonica]GLJ49635.1 hypothetical protein SUGI_1053090 [Cryptomeria japonica]
MNFDSASRGNPGPSGAGYIVGDDRGDLVVGASVKLPDGSNNDVEYAAILAGLSKCIEMGLDNIDIEGVSLNVARTVAHREPPSWMGRMWMEVICVLADRLNSFSISHVYREANKCADFLSNHAIDRQDIQIVSKEMKAWRETLTRLFGRG